MLLKWFCHRGSSSPPCFPLKEAAPGSPVWLPLCGSRPQSEPCNWGQPCRCPSLQPHSLWSRHFRFCWSLVICVASKLVDLLSEPWILRKSFENRHKEADWSTVCFYTLTPRGQRFSTLRFHALGSGLWLASSLHLAWTETCLHGASLSPSHFSPLILLST